MRRWKRLKKVLLPIFVLALIPVMGCSGNENTLLYEFEMDSDGKADGWGVCEYPDGTIYEGEMSHGYFDGLGLCLMKTDEGDMIRAAEYLHSESLDNYNYAIEYYPDNGRVVFGQNKYDDLGERWTVMMENDPSVMYTVRCFALDQQSDSGERERLRFNYYYDGYYEVIFLDENGDQINNDEITTYFEEDGIEMGYFDNEEEGIGLWFEDYGSLVRLASTIDSMFSCSGVDISENMIDIGGFNLGNINGSGIEYHVYENPLFFIINFDDYIVNGEALCCDFTNNVYYKQEYDMGELVSEERLAFPNETSESVNQGESTLYASETVSAGRMWIIGEGEFYADTYARSTQDKIPYTEQIDGIMESFEEFNAENSIKSHGPNASYRMFELLCVIAEELDTSGNYAVEVAKSAQERYEETDAGLSYSNFQIINGLYRCEEMLSSIMYELGGEESVAEIEEIFMDGPYEEIAKDNFLEVEGEAAITVFRYLYAVSLMLDIPDLPYSVVEEIYEDWQSDMQVVEYESNKAAYSSGMRQYTGSLYRIYELLDQIAYGLDTSGLYSDDILNIEIMVNEAKETWEGNTKGKSTSLESPYYNWDASMLDASASLLGIIARLLNPETL